ncbi:alpha/beta hydrolase family protein [Alkanindiges sp. WGS2144]|uniref:alpha/beta hydrolase family protein n=1 Tax=Alkanindiges sp. WGS2144 TaxID=3366808 RepID=UPI0037538C88
MNHDIHFSKIFVASTLVSTLVLSGCHSDNEDHQFDHSTQALVTKTENYAPEQTETATSVSQKITYRMPAVNGGQTTATAVVMLPKGQMPTDGWPVVVWAHGTTGVADKCAPSNLKDNNGQFTLGNALPLVQQLLNQGYAVIAPDYEGLGSPGIHPFLNAKSESESIISALKAAKQQYNTQLSKDWVVVGHSQGGHAAIAAAERAGEAGLDFKGVVAYAPASNLGTILLGGYGQVNKALGSSAGIPTAKAVLPGLQAFSALVAAGIKQSQPQFTYSTAFTSERSANIAAIAETECYPEVAADFSKDIEEFYAESSNADQLYPGLDVNFNKIPPIAVFLLDSTIGQKPINYPVVVLQGVDDTTVPPGATQLLEQQMRSANNNNAKISFTYQPGKDHGTVIADALDPNGQLANFLKANLPAK